MIRYTPTEAGQTGPQASADGMGELYAREAEMDERDVIDRELERVRERAGVAPTAETPRQNRETPPRHVRWLIAGAGIGFILGMGAMEVLG